MAVKFSLKDHRDYLMSNGHLIEYEDLRYTGVKIEDYLFLQTCDLCGREDLENHFIVKDLKDNTLLWVGSGCVRKCLPSLGDVEEIYTAVYFNLSLEALYKKRQT